MREATSRDRPGESQRSRPLRRRPLLVRQGSPGAEGNRHRREAGAGGGPPRCAPGSGKSTATNLLPRFYDVASGRVTIDDVDVRDVTLKSLRRNIGIVQQDVFLFGASLRENIAYGREDATMDEIVRAARIAQLHDHITSLDDGYDTVIGERGVTLSGGQRQRMSIARAVLLDPPILILDDSTSSVDAGTEELIRTAMESVMRGRTTFVIAHRLSTVHKADQILVHGRRRDSRARHAPGAPRAGWSLPPDPRAPATAPGGGHDGDRRRGDGP